MGKILVTGGAGFIGSHIADALILKGHEVVIVDNLVTGKKENVNPKAKFYETDIRDDGIADIFMKEKFEVVFHQAAQMDVRKSVADPRYDAEVNILGTLNLLQNCQKFGVKKFIFASTSGAIYGEQSVFPATEEHPLWPSSPYGVAKMACERYIHFFGLQYGLKYALMRYSNVYGPRQNPHGEAGVVAIFCKNLLAGNEVVINGEGKQTRDYVYVGDVVSANLSALNYEKNDYFNVSTGMETDVNTIFRKIWELTGSKSEEKHGSAKPGEQMRSVLSNEKVKRLLLWEPRVLLDEGLEKTVEFFRGRVEKQ